MRVFAPFVYFKEQLLPATIHIQNGRILKINPQTSASDTDLVLDNHLILPGFVNAHCHLELTGLGTLDQPSAYPISFVDWIRRLVLKKSKFDDTQRVPGMHDGIQMLLKSGVTTLGDHASFDTDLTPLLNSKLKGKIFGEVLGLAPGMAAAIYAYWKQAQGNARFQIHPSPHSVHAIPSDILKQVIENEAAPLSCHLAESESEEAFFKSASGELYDFIKKVMPIEPPETESGWKFLKSFGISLQNLTLVHGNYFSEEELDEISELQIPIIHCPGSHAYFGHKEFPMQECFKKNIPVALGTDSLASNENLNFLEELRRVRKSHPALTAEQIIRMATINGAKALRMEDQIGSITPGKIADLIGIWVHSGVSPLETLFQTQQVNWMMIDGQVL